MLPRKIRQGRRTKSDRGAILHKVAREEFSKKYHSSRDLNEVRKHWGRVVKAGEIPFPLQEHFDMMEKYQEGHCGWSAVSKRKGVRR